MRSKTITFTEFYLDIYEGTLLGNNRHITQDLTMTTCFYEAFTCKPEQIPNSIIVWERAHHRFSLYEDKGYLLVHEIKNFFLIPNLGVGGTAVKREKTNILLDSGYLISKENTKLSKEFVNETETFLTKNRFSAKIDFTESRFIRQMMRTSETVSHLTNALCKNNKKLDILESWILAHFPNEAANYLFEEEGKEIQLSGDSYLVSNCLKITNFSISWDRKINNTCFELFPVKIENNNKMFFLDLHRRQVYSKSTKISCNFKKIPLFIRDKNGALFSKFPGEKFKKVTETHPNLIMADENLPNLAPYNIKLRHYDQKRLHRTTLLDLVVRQTQNFEELTRIRSESESENFAAGLRNVIGKTLLAAAKGGSEIIHELGNSITKVIGGVSELDKGLINAIGNGSSNIIDSTGNSISKILKSFMSSFLLWILVLTLYLILGAQVYMKLTGTTFNLGKIRKIFKKQTDDENKASAPTQEDIYGSIKNRYEIRNEDSPKEQIYDKLERQMDNNDSEKSLDSYNHLEFQKHERPSEIIEMESTKIPPQEDPNKRHKAHAHTKQNLYPEIRSLKQKRCNHKTTDVSETSDTIF